jgi:hypothetical protein
LYSEHYIQDVCAGLFTVSVATIVALLFLR